MVLLYMSVLHASSRCLLSPLHACDPGMGSKWAAPMPDFCMRALTRWRQPGNAALHAAGIVFCVSLASPRVVAASLGFAAGVLV